MNTPLPEDFTVRAPTPDDVPAIVELIGLNELDEVGVATFSEGDLQADWQRPGFNPSTDAWLIHAPDGAPVAYADVWDSGRMVYLYNNSSVHPDYRNRGLEDWYVGAAEGWAQARIHDRPPILRHVVNVNVPSRVARMVDRGYLPVRQAYIMYIELDTPPPPPRIPAGITFRAFERGGDERATWACIQEAFRDMWDHRDSSFELWATLTVEHAGFAPDLCRLALDGDEIVGAVLTLDYPGEGWLQQVAVRRPWRHRGIALGLMRAVLTELYARGRPRAGLSVDGESQTGALELYERAGMHVAEHFTEFRKALPQPVLEAIS